ncbi:unnamed protein product [Notodromas monacha]|uniref:Uncharacterized protein n=1 Tax=Notodromas monacha TaxID=399045 RepID=A0A7R9BTN4_9CRUS|nr:unnamed protein product [Notodromas monacha]CAG0920137.1 unnamed protein product [Notodromas monacha]
MATGDWDEPSRKEVGTSMTLADSPGRRRGVLSSAARMRRPRVGRQKRGVGADGGNGGGDVAAAAAAGDESSDDGRMRARDSLELYRRHHLHQVRARSAEGAGGARRRRIRVGHLPEDDGIKVAPVAPAKDVYDYPESMKFDNTMDPPKPRVLIQKHPKRPPSRHTKDHSSKTKVDPAPVIAPPMYSAILCNRARQAAVKQKLKELTELLEAPDLPPLKMDSSHFEDLRGPLDNCSSSEMHHRRRRISFCLASDSGDAGDTEENKVPKRRIKPSPEMVASVNLRPLATKPCKVSKNIETTADAWHLTLTCTGQNKNQKTHFSPAVARHLGNVRRQAVAYQNKNSGKQEVRKDTSEKEGKVKISKSHRGRHMNPVFVPPPHAFPNPWESHFAARAPGYYCDCWDCINTSSLEAESPSASPLFTLSMNLVDKAVSRIQLTLSNVLRNVPGLSVQRSLVAEIQQVSELAARAGAGSVACDEDPAITRSEIPETAEMYQIPGTRTEWNKFISYAKNISAILETEAEIPAPLLVEEGSDIAVEDDSSSKDPRGSPQTGSTLQNPLRKHAFAEEKFPGAHQEPAVDYIHAVTDHSLQSEAPVTAENTDTRTIMKRGDLIVDTRCAILFVIDLISRAIRESWEFVISSLIMRYPLRYCGVSDG